VEKSLRHPLPQAHFTGKINEVKICCKLLPCWKQPGGISFSSPGLQDDNAGVPTFVHVVLGLLVNGAVGDSPVRLGTAPFLKAHPKPIK